MELLKVIFTSACFTFFLHSCSTVEKKVVSHKEQLNQERTIDGQRIKVGLWIETFDSSIQIANYKNGLKQGMVKTLYKNGEQSIANYKDNVQQGVEKFYRKDGVVYLELVYEKGNVVQRKSYTPSF